MISTILQYSTLDFIFLDINLKQISKFSDEIIVPVCSRLYNGQLENQYLLQETEKIIQKYPQAKLIKFDWEGNKEHNCYYHNLSRKIGTELAKNDWLLFLDADEIPSDEFKEWFSSVSHLEHSWWFSCYWYFREPIYQAISREGAGLLIPKKYTQWDLTNKLERAQLFQSLYDNKKITISDEEDILSKSGKKLIHHYSWVRSMHDMLAKVKHWGHKDDKDWTQMIIKEFSGPFMGSDFVHNYKYNIVDNYFGININNIYQLLYQYILNPENCIYNYNLALYYESIDQTASALSYFLRCAERTDIPELQYECLIRGSQCFEKQGKRNFTVKGLLQHAISICPKRPEGYYFLSKFYEKEDRDGHWQDSYMIASIGEKLVDADIKPLSGNINYPGLYGIIFQKGVAAWWCGLVQESRDIFINLLHKEKFIDPAFINPSIDNLKLMKTKPFINYDKQKHKLKHLFNDYEIILNNYSEAFQDILVLTLFNGKKYGTYLEIGGGDPIYGNNTFLLESLFNWKGISIDIDENTVQNYNRARTNKCFCKDASAINYNQFLFGLGYTSYIDYLQIDCDPPEITYNILLTLPLDKYEFGIITYEHDYYCDDTKSFQYKSSQYLESYGYKKIVTNVAPDNHRNYEDWWINPKYIEENTYNKIINIDNSVKNSYRLFLKDPI